MAITIPQAIMIPPYHSYSFESGAFLQGLLLFALHEGQPIIKCISDRYAHTIMLIHRQLTNSVFVLVVVYVLHPSMLMRMKPKIIVIVQQTNANIAERKGTYCNVVWQKNTGQYMCAICRQDLTQPQQVAPAPQFSGAGIVNSASY